MDTTDFMQKLSRHAQQTGELMEEAVRQMERLQADCADRNRWKQIAEAQNKRIDELEATAKGFQELCESINQTNTAMGKKLLQMQAELEQARAERDAAVKELQKTKSVAFKAETSNGLCSGKLTTPTYRQQGCDFCAGENKDWNNTTAHDFRLNGDGLFYNDYQFGWEGIKVNFCPMCGRRLED